MTPPGAAMSGFSVRSAASPSDEKVENRPAVLLGTAVIPQVRLTGPSARRASISSPSAWSMNARGMGTPGTAGGPNAGPASL